MGEDRTLLTSVFTELGCSPGSGGNAWAKVGLVSGQWPLRRGHWPWMVRLTKKCFPSVSCLDSPVGCKAPCAYTVLPLGSLAVLAVTEVDIWSLSSVILHTGGDQLANGPVTALGSKSDWAILGYETRRKSHKTREGWSLVFQSVWPWESLFSSPASAYILPQ